MKLLIGFFVFSLIAVSTYSIPVASSSYPSDSITSGLGGGGSYSERFQLTSGVGVAEVNSGPDA